MNKPTKEEIEKAVAHLNGIRAKDPSESEAARYSEARKENSAYWRDKSDPMGVRHGHDKWMVLNEEIAALRAKLDQATRDNKSLLDVIATMRGMISRWGNTSELYEDTPLKPGMLGLMPGYKRVIGYELYKPEQKPAIDPMTEIRKMLR